MRNLYKVFFLTVFLGAAHIVVGQSVAAPFEIGIWKDFKPAAVSYTFDDNCPNQLVVGVPMFDKFGFKLTLFTVINWAPNWASLQAAANNGHEIASHTVTHPSLDSINASNQSAEYEGSKNIINSKIKGQSCVTIAYPFCIAGNSKLCAGCYIAARGCNGYVESATPKDFMNVGALICGSEGGVKIASQFNFYADWAAKTKGWCIFMMHSIDNDGGYSPVKSTELNAHLNYVNENNAKFWVGTFGNVTRYIKERDAASLKVISARSKHISIQLTDQLDNGIYNYPISIRRPLPKGWSAANVTQGKMKLKVQHVTIAAVNYIMFDAVPNAGLITLTRQKATNMEWEKKMAVVSGKMKTEQNRL